MASSQPNLAVGIFEADPQAHGALEALKQAGFGPDQIRVARHPLDASAGGREVPAVDGGNPVGTGVPENQAGTYPGQYKADRTVIAVAAGSRYNEALTILRSHGAWSIAPGQEELAEQEQTRAAEHSAPPVGEAGTM